MRLVFADLWLFKESGPAGLRRSARDQHNIAAVTLVHGGTKDNVPPETACVVSQRRRALRAGGQAPGGGRGGARSREGLGEAWHWRTSRGSRRSSAVPGPRGSSPGRRRGCGAAGRSSIRSRPGPPAGTFSLPVPGLVDSADTSGVRSKPLQEKDFRATFSLDVHCWNCPRLSPLAERVPSGSITLVATSNAPSVFPPSWARASLAAASVSPPISSVRGVIAPSNRLSKSLSPSAKIRNRPGSEPPAGGSRPFAFARERLEHRYQTSNFKP